MKRGALFLMATSIASACLLIAGVITYSGTYGLNVILRRGASIWVTVEPNDTRISGSMRLALQDAPPAVRPGAFTWQQLDRGFEVGELPVMADHAEVDRILLVRIDPAHFRFQVWNRPSGSWDSQDWMRGLGAVLVTNGSYFTRYGTPETPILSSGFHSGPRAYDAKHGAFVASRSFVGIRDFAQVDWREAFRGADDGMVSYPMLIGIDGSSRSRGDARWLANRTFVAQTEGGHIILGTTKDAFFSLDRLAAFLRTVPLGIRLALNLDGGPVACQAIRLKGFERDFCGQWEIATRGSEVRLLRPLLGNRRWGLPMVLAVLAR
jgi:hypothetical protein